MPGFCVEKQRNFLGSHAWVSAVQMGRRRLTMPTEFFLDPGDCDHGELWYVFPEKTVCGECGTEIPKATRR